VPGDQVPGGLSAAFVALEEMGDAAVGIMAAVVTGVEMVPLVPTQPASISCGLLFGAQVRERVCHGNSWRASDRETSAPFN
jgi:hypothetical protein